VLSVVATPPLPGPDNMALDLALLDLAARGLGPFLRLYAWSGPWISLGYAQRPADAVDLGRSRDAGVGVVRRPSGGKALLHAGDVTYSVALPAAHPVARLGVVASYRALAARVVAALADLGVPAELAEPPAMTGGRGGRGRLRAPIPCAAELEAESIVAGGPRKLVGSAQVRRRRALLQHGSIPLFDPPRDLILALRGRGAGDADADAFVAWYRSRTASLGGLGCRAAPADVQVALARAFRDL
jgi:lipoate-protein ligase A